MVIVDESRRVCILDSLFEVLVLMQALGDRQEVVISEALALLSGMIDAGWVRRRSLLAVLAADSARVSLQTSFLSLRSPRVTPSSSGRIFDSKSNGQEFESPRGHFAH